MGCTVCLCGQTLNTRELDWPSTSDLTHLIMMTDSFISTFSGIQRVKGPLMRCLWTTLLHITTCDLQLTSVHTEYMPRTSDASLLPNTFVCHYASAPTYPSLTCRTWSVSCEVCVVETVAANWVTGQRISPQTYNILWQYTVWNVKTTCPCKDWH